jgi:hemolysin activation/secretion protein
MSTLQNRLVDHGWITTRVLAPSQDLKSGTLKLMIVPGYVRHVRLTEQSDDYIRLYSAFPAHEGNLLDLRDIEQGLENLQRLPTVEASMEIVPGDNPGESDIVITRKQAKMWRLGLSLDDSGTETTGRYQGGVTLSLDNPFHSAICSIFPPATISTITAARKAATTSATIRYRTATGCWG